MWRKRASYDPMKAVAEGKKKQELARRSSQQSKYCDNRCDSFAFFHFIVISFFSVYRYFNNRRAVYQDSVKFDLRA